MTTFKKGDRVRMTRAAIEQYLDAGRGNNTRGTTTGTVVSDKCKHELIRVLRDGNKNPSTYWFGFWEKLDD